MKTTLLLSCTLVVAVFTIPPVISTVSDDVVERIANYIAMTTDEVLTCFNKTRVTDEDLMHFDQHVVDDLEMIDFDPSALKIGCLLACLAQKKEIMTGAHINVNKLKEIIRTKLNQHKADKQNKIAQVFQILDRCADRVKSKTNECDVILKFVLCGVIETDKIRL